MYGMTQDVLYSNNPQIDANCSNIYVNEVLCVATTKYSYPAFNSTSYQVSLKISLFQAALPLFFLFPIAVLTWDEKWSWHECRHWLTPTCHGVTSKCSSSRGKSVQRGEKSLTSYIYTPLLNLHTIAFISSPHLLNYCFSSLLFLF